MTDLFDEPDDATPLTPDERKGLVPSDITYRRELNKAEQENIMRAQDWALSRRRNVLTERFVKSLHGRMLGDVWRWAGDFRTSERNIGISYYEIPMALRQVLADAAAWIEHQAYVPDEIALRFHHKLVQIHPFPNGNGRHSRLMADLLVMQLGRERFTWGSTSLQDADDVRRRYISALEAAKRFYVHHDCAASPVDPMTMTITLADVEKAMGIADRVAILGVAHRRNG